MKEAAIIIAIPIALIYAAGIIITVLISYSIPSNLFPIFANEIIIVGYFLQIY